MKRSGFATLVPSIALIATAFPAASAQTAPSATGSSPSRTGETVELSPFVVQSGKDTGYVATDTIAGSRLNTPLIDTSAAIDVLTIEFLEDIGATTLEEALEYAVNADNDIGIDGGGNDQFGGAAPNIHVRGLRASRTRNFLPITYSADIYNVDRVEEQRGPNSILFGIGTPAGVINVNTKRALLGQSIRRLSAMIGGEGGYRATADLNVPVHRNLALRLNAVRSDLDDAVSNFAYRETNSATLAATWKASDRIRIRAEVEQGRIFSVESHFGTINEQVTRWLGSPSPRLTFADWQNPGVNIATYGIASLGNAIRVAYVDNNDTVVNYRGLHTTAGTGLVVYERNAPELWDRSVNMGGPGQKRDLGMFSVGGSAEIKLTSRTHLELAFNRSEMDLFTHMFGQSVGLRGDPNRFLSNKTTPNIGAGKLYLEGAWARWQKVDTYTSYRATLSHEEDFKKWGNYRLALMHETDDQFFSNFQQREKWVDASGRGLFNADPANATNNVWRRHYIETEGQWMNYFVSSPAFGLIQAMQTDTGQTASSAWRAQNSGQAADSRYGTLLAALQARYFRNRLVLGGGIRKDKLKQRMYASQNENNQFYTNEYGERVLNYGRWDDTYFDGKTTSLGAVYHLNPTLRLLYNVSDNFGVQSNARQEYPKGGPPANTEGEGFDVGIGFRLWGDRISGRITRFETDSRNVYLAAMNLTNTNDNLLEALVASQAVTGINQARADSMYIFGTGATVDQHVEGYEFSITANLTKNWRLRASYSFTDGYQTNSLPDQREYRDGDPNGRLGGFGGITFFENPAWANLPVLNTAGMYGGTANTIGEYIQGWKGNLAEELAADGVTLPRNRPHKANIMTNYSFDQGSLKGFSIGAGGRFRSAADLGLGLKADGTPIALKGSPAYWITNFQARYAFKQLWRLKGVWLQLNIDNALDYSDYIITARNATTHEISRVVYERPRTWKLSTNFSF